jgi:hypothetical protein
VKPLVAWSSEEGEQRKEEEGSTGRRRALSLGHQRRGSTERRRSREGTGGGVHGYLIAVVGRASGGAAGHRSCAIACCFSGCAVAYPRHVVKDKSSKIQDVIPGVAAGHKQAKIC